MANGGPGRPTELAQKPVDQETRPKLAAVTFLRRQMEERPAQDPPQTTYPAHSPHASVRYNKQYFELYKFTYLMKRSYS